MSFSSGVKDELARVMPERRSRRIAETAAILSLAGRVGTDDGGLVLAVSSEHAATVRKYFTLLKKTYKIENGVSVRKRQAGSRGHSYTVELHGTDAVNTLLKGCSLTDGPCGPGTELFLRDRRLVSETGCRRAFLRGAFLAAGSLSDPEKSYHLEFVCPGMARAELIRELLSSFGCQAGIVARKRSQIVYLKDSSEIVDALGVMEAPAALMDMENVRIMKDMRNSVNRKVNCETANIQKTVGAAVKQLRDIEYIRDREGLEGLPPALREMAEVRLRYPDAPLKDLGKYLVPEVGKSGVNHRLRKLSEYASELRGKKRPGITVIQDGDPSSEGAL